MQNKIKYEQSKDPIAEKVILWLLVALYFGVCVLMFAVSHWCLNLSIAAEEPNFTSSLQAAFGILLGIVAGAGITIGFFLLLEEVFG